MTDPGLTNRLRQHSRRAGIAVGLSMALTVAICIGGFALIYAKVDPLTRDFVSSNPTTRPSAGQGVTSTLPAQPAAQSGVGAGPTSTPAPTPEPTKPPQPTPTTAAFKATHKTVDFRVKLRPKPTLATEDAVTVMDPATPLQALGDTTTDADGNLWLKVKIEDGSVGWVREASTQQLTASQ